MIDPLIALLLFLAEKIPGFKRIVRLIEKAKNAFEMAKFLRDAGFMVVKYITGLSFWGRMLMLGSLGGLALGAGVFLAFGGLDLLSE